MKEKDFQTEFSKRNTLEGCFELKLCKGTSLPFDALKDHQKEALLAVSGKGLFHKITDQPIFKGSKVRFTKPKPFDCFYLKDVVGYVVVMFWVTKEKEDCILYQYWRMDHDG